MNRPPVTPPAGPPADPPAGDRPPAVSARRLLALVLPAAVVGAGSSLVLIGLSRLAARLEHLWWSYLPQQLGFGPWDRWWIVTVLTGTGLLVGLAVWKLPGHGGPDPATLGLVDPPQPVAVLPGLAVVTMLALAGGVSLGPENPIVMINVALTYWAGRRLLPGSPVALWVALAAAGTIGALFGTAIGAALILSELPAGRNLPAALWDRLFAPLVSASAGSLTTLLLVGNEFAVDLPVYPAARTVDLGWAMLASSAGAALGMAAVYAFAPLHRLFGRLRNPVVTITTGGVLLGLLGALGGHLTLFKGLDQLKELSTEFDRYSVWALLGLAVVKVAALLVAGTSGFRGGRIFPSVFVGAALGYAGHAAVPSVPVALAVSCAILGVLFAVTRQGWLSLFTAAVVVPDSHLLPFLCVAALPAWLIVTGRPLMLVRAGAPA
ncbi:ion channel protein [Kitasatospora sp. NPDC088346]|uniref:ion channel protein n=1 Tax=Kitasatospora sp. NPDC088346 TaxID=3364073 RepID=UPI00380CA105